MQHTSNRRPAPPPVPDDVTSGRTINTMASGLMGLSALLVGGFGIVVIVDWVARARADRLGAGEMFGIAVGISILGWGFSLGWGARAVWRDERGGWIFAALCATALVALAYIALSTPGPPPWPLPLSGSAVVIGLAIASLAIARAARRGSWWKH